MNIPGKLADPVLPGQVSSLLLQRKQTVAVAESVTAGHLQVAFSLAAHAMEFFQGGITAYNLGQKTRHLEVDPILALSCNCVSEEVSAQMAEQITHLFLSDWGIAITGYASPVPEQDIHELFACYAIYSKQTGMVTRTIVADKNPPAIVRHFYTIQVIDHFRQLLEEK